MSKQQSKFSVVNFIKQDIPMVIEDSKTRYQWVPVGINDQDDYFHLLTEAYNTSTTNAACIDGKASLVYGKGLVTDDKAFEPRLKRLVPPEEIKRVFFDLTLYGNAAFQVVWNKEHTKVVKLFHIPTQTLRAEKLVGTTKIEGYFYCTDWDDYRKVKEKIRIPSFGSSTEEREIYYIKEYEPNRFYYSLPDWISALQYSFAEAELSNLHLNNIENGFLPVAMLNFNNGVPAPEERQTIENLVQGKFTGTPNAGSLMISFNDDPLNKPTIDVIAIDNLHEKYSYVAEYSQDRILVAHRIVSPLLFGIRTATNGFSSQAEEMKTAFSIFQTMTIQPKQQMVLGCIDYIFNEGGIGDYDLYIDQLTPLVILSETAEDTDTTIEEVQDDVNDNLQNDETIGDEFLKKDKPTHLRFSDYGFTQNFKDI